MNSAFPLLLSVGILCVMGLIISAIVALIAVPLIRQRQGVWEKAAASLNLDLKDAKSKIEGELDGVHVVADMHYTTRNTADGSLRSTPNTRVRAVPSPAPPLYLRDRRQELTDVTPPYPIRPTGDPALDEAFEIGWPEEEELDSLLPADARQPLLSADTPIHIVEGIVLSTQRGMLRDPARLEAIVRTCATIAKQLDREER